MDRAEGVEQGRVCNRTAFSKEQEQELAERIRAEKGEERAYITEQALRFYEECYSHALRSNTVATFACSPQWVSGFRLRNCFV